LELTLNLRAPTLSERIACRVLGHVPTPAVSYSIEIRDVDTGALLVHTVLGLEVEPPICSRCRREVSATLQPSKPWPRL
jgi:hypothetical protein